MKPDWATRLQRTFARKYDAGFAKGLMLGKAVATRDEQERIIELLEDHGQYMNNHEVYAANRLIALIKGEK